MSKEKPVKHGRDHRPVGWYGNDDPGGSDPLPSMGPFPWCRARKWSGSNQTITSSSETQITWNSFVNDYTDWFDQPDSGHVRVLRDGLYLIKGRGFWTTSPGDEAIVMLAGIDTDTWADYPGGAGQTNHTLVSYVDSWARLPANASISLNAYQTSGSSKDLDGTGGCFLELVRLGPVTVTETDGGP